MWYFPQNIDGHTVGAGVWEILSWVNASVNTERAQSHTAPRSVFVFLQQTCCYFVTGVIIRVTVNIKRNSECYYTMCILMPQVSYAQESIQHVLRQGDSWRTLSPLPESPARGIIPNFNLRLCWTRSACTGACRVRSEACIEWGRCFVVFCFDFKIIFSLLTMIDHGREGFMCVRSSGCCRQHHVTSYFTCC